MWYLARVATGNASTRLLIPELDWIKRSFLSMDRQPLNYCIVLPICYLAQVLKQRDSCMVMYFCVFILVDKCRDKVNGGLGVKRISVGSVFRDLEQTLLTVLTV